MDMVIDHICIAVKNINEIIGYWEDVFGYKQFTESIINTRQKVKVVFLNKAGSLMIKLIEPLPENKSLVNFVEMGGGIHHICFKCDDLKEKINEFANKDVRLLVPPQPGEAFANHDIAFFWAKNRINFELIDTDEKAGLIE
jgi:methylmalonyl-CoA/ethylmalonyl-CoA epimerase